MIAAVAEDSGNGREQQWHGRYYAEYVQVTSETEPQEGLREVLEAGESKEWHLVAVAGGLPNGGMVLFWDTARPSFGRGYAQ